MKPSKKAREYAKRMMNDFDTIYRSFFNCPVCGKEYQDVAEMNDGCCSCKKDEHSNLDAVQYAR